MWKYGGKYESQKIYDEFNTTQVKLKCQTANCGRRFLHFDFGVFASLIALSFLSRRIPGGVAA